MASSHSSIGVLPQELLEKAFLECVPYPTSSDLGPPISRNHPAVVLSHVCHEWRVLSLNNPMLWSHMHIRLPSSKQIPLLIDWRDAVKGLASAIEIWIERSAPCLITVILNLHVPKFGLPYRSWITQTPKPDDYVCIPRSIFKGSKRWKEVDVDVDCDSYWGSLATFSNVCREYPAAAGAFPNLEALSIQITASSGAINILQELCPLLVRRGPFSAPSLRRLSVKGYSGNSHSRSLQEWGRGLSLLTDLYIEPPDVNSMPALFGPSDALRLLEAVPSLTRASFGLDVIRVGDRDSFASVRVTARNLTSLSLHGVPPRPHFSRALSLPSLSHLGLLFYPWVGRTGSGTLLVNTPIGSCLDFLDNKKLETLSFVPNHFPAQRRQAVYGPDTHAIDVKMDELNCTALAYIVEPLVFPNLKRFEMNVYNASRDDACSRALLEFIESRRGRVEDIRSGGHESAVGAGDTASDAEDFGYSGSTHSCRQRPLQDVHVVFSTSSPFDIVEELLDRRVDLGFNLRLDYPNYPSADARGTSRWQS
ncbi:hypothetical protein NMY22_g12685 [Coprinellus aureogranulatus]|nr:hypothetical protein NMY22_g12685 [Coprinellus aureogranulatus]